MNYKNTIKILIALLLLPISYFCWSQNAPVSKVEPIEPYKILYEHQNEWNDKILNTIYWSLWISVTLVAGIIFSSFFFNFRFNKKEFELLKSETTAELNKKLDEIISNKINEIRHESKSWEENYKTLLNSYSDNFWDRINGIKEEYRSHKESTESQLNEMRKTFQNELNMIQKDFEYRVKSLQRSSLWDAANFWESKPHFYIALNRYIDILDIDIKERNKDWWQFTLRSIADCLESIQKTEDWIANYQSDKLTKLINNISDENGLLNETSLWLINQINRLLKSIKITED